MASMESGEHRELDRGSRGEGQLLVSVINQNVSVCSYYMLVVID